MAKKHDHGFEMMVIVAIVAVVGLIIMFMNTGNLSGEAISEKKQPTVTNTPLLCGNSAGDTWWGYTTDTNPPVAHCYWL
jgi:hypothetical protein